MYDPSSACQVVVDAIRATPECSAGYPLALHRFYELIRATTPESNSVDVARHLIAHFWVQRAPGDRPHGLADTFFPLDDLERVRRIRSYRTNDHDADVFVSLCENAPPCDPSCNCGGCVAAGVHRAAESPARSDDAGLPGDIREVIARLASRDAPYAADEIDSAIRFACNGIESVDPRTARTAMLVIGALIHNQDGSWSITTEYRA